MILFDLSCQNGHIFEAWFASAAAFDEQRKAGLLRCPVCGSSHVEKRLSAKVSVNHSAPSESDRKALAEAGEALRKLRQEVQNAEDVGERFADEARKMHGGDIPVHAIRGKTSFEEAQNLIEEGVPFEILPEFLVKKPN